MAILKNIRKELLGRLLSFLWAGFILVISLMPATNIPKVHVWNADKIVHAGIYFVLAWMLNLGFSRTRNIARIIFFIAAGYGLLIEILQGTCTSDRQFDWYDVLANSLGVLLFLGLKRFANSK